MPTQREIADHLGISQQAVSAQMAPLGIDWRNSSIDEVRIRYLDHLRGVAAGHRSADGIDLARERALTERVDRQLKELNLAEKLGQLVNLQQLEPELERMFVAFRTELLARDDKLKEEIAALYGVDVDLAILNEHTRNALSQLARYDPSGRGVDPAAGPSGGSPGGDDDDGLGEGAEASLSEGDGEAGEVQP